MQGWIKRTQKFEQKAALPPSFTWALCYAAWHLTGLRRECGWLPWEHLIFHPHTDLCIYVSLTQHISASPLEINGFISFVFFLCYEIHDFMKSWTVAYLINLQYLSSSNKMNNACSHLISVFSAAKVNCVKTDYFDSVEIIWMLKNIRVLV